GAGRGRGDRFLCLVDDLLRVVHVGGPAFRGGDRSPQSIGKNAFSLEPDVADPRAGPPARLAWAGEPDRGDPASPARVPGVLLPGDALVAARGGRALHLVRGWSTLPEPRAKATPPLLRRSADHSRT